MNNYNLTHTHVSVIRDALETQIGNLQDRLDYESHRINDKEKKRLQSCIDSRKEALDVMLIILSMRGHEPVDIHIKR